jgi:uncharacterized membrane protein
MEEQSIVNHALDSNNLKKQLQTRKFFLRNRLITYILILMMVSTIIFVTILSGMGDADNMNATITIILSILFIYLSLIIVTNILSGIIVKKLNQNVTAKNLLYAMHWSNIIILIIAGIMMLTPLIIFSIPILILLIPNIIFIAKLINQENSMNTKVIIKGN